MNLTRDDLGNIREMHSKSSGTNHNYRDASNRTQLWQKSPTLIQTPGKSPQGSGSNPYSGRMTSGKARKPEDREGRAGSSTVLRTSPRRDSKRQKLDYTESSTSKFFLPSKEVPRRRPAQIDPSTSTFSHHSLATDAITIEDDTPAAKDDDPPEPIVLRTSSPDPMDIIPSHASYTFDQNKPSPIEQFSSSLEGRQKPPQDGPSTERLRRMVEAKEPVLDSASCTDGDGDDLAPRRHVSLRSGSTPRAGTSSGGSNVKSKVALFEQQETRIIDLRTVQSKMKRKSVPARKVNPLPLELRDIDATRPSGFASSSKSSKGKVAVGRVSVHLPLTEWSIGVAVSPQGVTTDPQVNLVLESGFLKVRDASGSTQFELQIKETSLAEVKYVDIKKTTTPAPLIQIRPSVMANARNHADFRFKPGSSCPKGLLTFKFDTSAREWDGDVYMGIVQNLVDAISLKGGKSILDGPAAKAVWEVVMRVHEDPLLSFDPEPILDIPKEDPPDPLPKRRSRAGLRPPGTTIKIPVRRSARLSGSEQEWHSPRPDPDEVILRYRSGTGSLSITNGDVSRLKPGEFLNDTLIEFGLKLWLADLQESNPELASQVHVFSSFFYKKISTKIPEEGYNSVKKWTSRFDLFQKKYIIVPINENLHWYLAIIYFPEHTLLPRPVQETKTDVHARRSTRQLGVIIDSSDALQPDPASRLSLPPEPDPPPNGLVLAGPSESIDPETPKTDDRKDEFDVELMVESDVARVDPTAKPVGAASPDTLECPESPTLVYPHSSSPLAHLAMLPTLDLQGDSAEQLDHPRPEEHFTPGDRAKSLGVSEGDSTRTTGILPSTFYGTKSEGRRDATPQLAPINDSVLPDIEIDEDETMGNPESEAEEVAEHPRTYIYTFDSLASKHPQAVKRLSRYLLMEARDKKQLDETTLNEPKGMQAIVPDQPNYCDCGIYLLHFAKTFMKDPKLSSDIIRRPSPQKGRRVPHEHWDGASVGNYRDKLADRIHSMSEEWKRQRSEHDSGTKNETDAGASGSGTAAPPEQQQQQQQQLQQQQQQPQPQQPRGDPTPTTSSKADNDSDSDIEVLSTPQKPVPSKAPRKDSGLGESRKRGPAARLRG